MENRTDILVIAPHPDDAEFCTAGAVAGWTHEGKQVVYVLCTSGEKGTSDRTVQPRDLAGVREREQVAAAKIVGVRDVVFMRMPDQGLEDTPDFRKRIVRLIRTYRPDTVVTCDPYRRYFCHRDHRITGQAVLDAVYPLARDHLSYADLLEEGLEPHKVREILFWEAEDINHRIDIADTFQRKLEALCCHESQVKGFGSPDIGTWLREYCQKMARGSDFELAEAFHRATFPP